MAPSFGQFLRWGASNLDVVETLGVMATDAAGESGPLPAEAQSKADAAIVKRCRSHASLTALADSPEVIDEDDLNERIQIVRHGLSVRSLALARKVTPDAAFLQASYREFLRLHPLVVPEASKAETSKAADESSPAAADPPGEVDPPAMADASVDSVAVDPPA